MPQFLAPTRIKILAAAVIAISSWLIAYLGDWAGTIYLDAKHPEFIEAMRQAIAPQIEKPIVAMAQDIAETGLVIGIVKVVVAACCRPSRIDPLPGIIFTQN